MSTNRLLVIDFGSQYTQLITRRVRELGVYCQIYPFDAPERDIRAFNPRCFILSGGPESVTKQVTPRIPDCVLSMQRPILGICYGMHALVTQLGGHVTTSVKQEFGYAQVHNLQCDPLLTPLDDTLDVWMSHGDRVVEMPPDFQLSASTTTTPIAAVSHPAKGYYGIQFHPEVTHTKNGTEIFRRFLFEISNCAADWSPAHIINASIADIRAQVGKEQVLLALSGGVDSSVTAALLARAIGHQLTCVFVDNGLLRKGERQEVTRAFAHSNLNFISVDISAQLLRQLRGSSDPEVKRKIVGKSFIKAFEAHARTLDVKWLAQGTIYPDVVESAATKFGASHLIKSHHNVGGLPDHFNLKLLEPLRDLFKDEVRKIGIELGLAPELVYRHPFPGPGLAVRILGEVRAEYLTIVREADAIYMEELRAHQWYEKVSQAFAVFLPVKSVGVKGDRRSYQYVIALRAVTTTDFMTADWAPLPPELMSHIANRIINEVPQVSRVVYDISSKPPATIEWE